MYLGSFGEAVQLLDEYWVGGTFLRKVPLQGNRGMYVRRVRIDVLSRVQRRLEEEKLKTALLEPCAAR